jgi:CHAD domain-containing protein
MSYALTFDEEPGRSLRRVAREQLEAAAVQLEDEHGDDPVEAVHDVRKRLKKTRALLRLARPGMPDDAYRRENAALRDAGRALSGTRDADVMVEALAALADRFAGQAPAALFEEVRGRLAARAAAARAVGAPAIGEHAASLRALLARVEGWQVDGSDDATLAAALARTYKRGRRAFRSADRDPTTERLHEWRKRAKDLWYQQALVSAAWPGVLSAQAGEAKALSKLLGDDHDLAVLAELLRDDAELTAAVAADRDALLDLIGRRRAELLGEARALGRRVYAERPKQYARRVRRYIGLAAGEQPVATG